MSTAEDLLNLSQSENKDQLIMTSLKILNKSIFDEGNLIWKRWSAYWLIMAALFVLFSQTYQDSAEISVSVCAFGFLVTIIWIPIEIRGWGWHKWYCDRFDDYLELAHLHIMPRFEGDKVNGSSIRISIYTLYLTISIIWVILGYFVFINS